MKSLPIALRSSSDFNAVEAHVRKKWLGDKEANVPSVSMVLLRTHVPHVIGVMTAFDHDKMSETIAALGFVVEREFVAVTGRARSFIGIVQ